MKLFFCPHTRALRALWLLEELQEPYELVVVDVRDDEARQDPAFRLVSPTGKVPALDDGPVKISESAAIAVYLADKYPHVGLAPGIDHPKRGAYLYWMFFVPSILEPALVEKLHGVEPNPQRNGWGSYESMLDIVDAALDEGPWLLGEHFTAADVMLGSSLHFLSSVGLWPVERPGHQDYINHCLERPAYKHALALEEKLAAKVSAPE